MLLSCFDIVYFAFAKCPDDTKMTLITGKLGRAVTNRINIAPMMDWTDRHCRYFMRLLSPSAFLYTEMVTAAAIHHGDAARLLRFDACRASDRSATGWQRSRVDGERNAKSGPVRL